MPANSSTRYNDSILVACQNGILTSMKPKQNVPTFTEETCKLWSLLGDVQTWHGKRNCGFPETVVSLGQTPPYIYIPRPPTNANRIGQVLCIQPSSAKSCQQHQIPSTILEQRLLPQCVCNPLSSSAIKVQRGLFGHMLRMLREANVQLAIDQYYTLADVAG